MSDPAIADRLKVLAADYERRAEVASHVDTAKDQQTACVELARNRFVALP